MTLLENFSGPVWQQLTWTLLHFFWQGIVVAIALAVVLWALPSRRAQTRYAVCLAALLCLAICPVATFLFSGSAGGWAAGQEVPRSALLNDEGLGVAPLPAVHSPPISRAIPQPPIRRHGATQATTNHAATSISASSSGTLPSRTAHLRPLLTDCARAAQPYLLMGWITGVSLLSVRLLLGLAGLQWLRRHRHPAPAALVFCLTRFCESLAIRSIPRIFVSGRIREAIAVGLLRPTILLPAAWLAEMTPEVLEAVIAHELAHIRRWDLWVNLLQRFLETVLFYHPAVWWVSRRTSAEREICCDELAVAVTGRRLGYAKALEQAASIRLAPTEPVFGAAFGGRNMALRNRVRHILGVSVTTANPMARWWPVGLVALLVPLGIWLSSASLNAQTQSTPAPTAKFIPDRQHAGTSGNVAKESRLLLAAATRMRPQAQPACGNPEPQTSVGPFSGTVFDPEGKPAAGVKVWVVVDDAPGDAPVQAETTTDENGQFRFAAIPWDLYEHWHWPRLFTRDSQGRIDGSRGSIETAPTQYRLPLQEVKDYQGRLLDPSGQPIAKATIMPLRLTCDENPELVNRYDTCAIPNPVRKELAVETRDDGSFTLRGLPGVGHVDVAVVTKDFGTTWARWDLAKPVSIRMRPSGNIQGSIRCDKDPQAVQRVKVTLSTTGGSEYSRVPAGSCILYYRAEAVIGADGTFRFDKVPAGQCSLNLNVPDAFPYLSEGLGVTQLNPNETATVSVTLKPALKLQGKVVDWKTKNGIPRVRITFHIQDAASGQSISRAASTDAQGAFVVHVPAGRAWIWMDGPFEQYIYTSSPQPHESIEIKEDMTLPPIELKCGKPVEGIVVDPSGKPVAGTVVYYTDFTNYRTIWDHPETGAAGTFVLKKVTPDTKTMIRVRTDKAVAEPLFIVAKEVKEPIRLVVSEKAACTLRGQVVDDTGKPIPGAVVHLTVLWHSDSDSADIDFPALKSDDNGRFELGGLWPGDEYHVEVAAEGHETVTANQTAGKAGEPIDFGKIVLTRLSGVVQGTVADSSGKPLPGVRVFNSGDGPDLITTTSDEGGRFRLAGLRAGPVFVFANKEGFRFTAVRTTSGATNASITMLRNDEPVPTQPPRSATISDQELKKLARKLTERYQAKGDQTAAAQMAAVVVAMGMVHTQDLQALAEKNPDEALKLIDKGPAVFQQLRQLVTRLAASDPTKALRFANEMTARARSLDPPERPQAIAQTGVLLARLGDKEAGRKLIEEAADQAAKMGTSESDKWRAAQVAGVIATVDLDRALELVKRLGNKNFSDYVRCLAAASLDDPQKAQEMLKGVNPWLVGHALSRVAYRLAAKDPAAALSLIEKMPPLPNGPADQNKAKAYGWLAKAIATKDKAQAWSLIDRALEIYMAPSEQRRFYSPRGGPSAQAAMLAVQAQEIGYTDMQGLIWRVLSLRPTLKDAYNPANVVEATVVMAALLALVDQDTAKELLQSLEPQSNALGSSSHGPGREAWFIAWALADPQHAMDLVERELASSPSQDKAKQQQAQRNVSAVITLWSLPPSERTNYLSQRFGIESPDQEY